MKNKHELSNLQKIKYKTEKNKLNNKAKNYLIN